MSFSIEPEELSRVQDVLSNILDAIRSNRTIVLPQFDPQRSLKSQIALQSVGCEENPYGSTIGDFRFQFEGEEDLLHLFVTKLDGTKITPEEGQHVARMILPELPSGLIWFKPGELSQHFYFGHDDLLASIKD